MQDHSWHAQHQARELEWKAVEWPDGTLYEGLASGNSCHRQGVLHFANSDRYEGEFVNNRMQGHGVYVWKDGTIYRGEWQFGMMHGCGVQLRRGPDGEYVAMEGKFFADEYVGPIMSCGPEAAQGAAVEADVAAALGRALQTEVGRNKRQAAGLGRGRGRGGKGEVGGEAAGGSGDAGLGAKAWRLGAEDVPQRGLRQSAGSAVVDSGRDGGGPSVASDKDGRVAQGQSAAGKAGPGPSSERAAAATPSPGARTDAGASALSKAAEGPDSGHESRSGAAGHVSKRDDGWFGLWGLGHEGRASNTNGAAGSGGVLRKEGAGQVGAQGQGWGFGRVGSPGGMGPPLGSIGPWRVPMCQLRWPWQPQQHTGHP